MNQNEQRTPVRKPGCGRIVAGVIAIVVGIVSALAVYVLATDGDISIGSAVWAVVLIGAGSLLIRSGWRRRQRPSAARPPDLASGTNKEVV